MSSISNKIKKVGYKMNIDNDIKKEINAAQREYYKEWRAKNKDKVKKYNDNYWTKKAQKNRAAESNSEE